MGKKIFGNLRTPGDQAGVHKDTCTLLGKGMDKENAGFKINCTFLLTDQIYRIIINYLIN